MILDLPRFITAERPYWSELESQLATLEADAGARLDLREAERLHYLFQRAAADLAKIATFAAEPEIRRYLENLVARAYSEIHETRARPHRLEARMWFLKTFPQTFRRHFAAFALTVVLTLLGAVFGGLVVTFDPPAKRLLLPFQHLHGDPRERVAQEEAAGEEDRLAGAKATFSTELMTHNTKVAIFTLALGVSWGIGTIVVLSYNGIVLGAVSLDYLLAGQTKFLAGWLLPHGAVEIPAILIAGQAGFVLAQALLGRGERRSVRARLRAVSSDLVTLIGGVAVMLVWAGLVEAFFSQYHEPVLPYAVKILFGTVELIALALYLGRAGAGASVSRRSKPAAAPP